MDIRKSALLICTAAFLITPVSANALTLNASLTGGITVLNGIVASNISPVSSLLGGELTADIGTYLQLGPFFDHNFIGYTDGSSGALRFFGGVLRAGLTGHGSNLFVDTKLGLSQRTGGTYTSEHGIGLGVGIGYRIWIAPYLDISPRLGARILPEPFQGTDASNTTFDGGLLLTFEF